MPAENDEWAKWHAVRAFALAAARRECCASQIKKRWAAKEEELRKKAAAVDESKVWKPVYALLIQSITEQKKSQIFSSKAASNLVTNCLIDLMKNGSKKCGAQSAVWHLPQRALVCSGIEAEAVNDNAFQWRVRMTGFPSDSQLYKDLMILKSRYDYSYVELGQCSATFDLVAHSH